MRYRLFLLTAGFSACILLAGLTLNADFVRRGPTVVVSVKVTDSGGGVLRYRWRSTDGAILDINSPATLWTLPAGPGLHFAYVLVSNGRGGYTERRIAVNTDTIGTPAPTSFNFATLVAPPSPAPSLENDLLRTYATGGPTRVPGDPTYHSVYVPDVLAHAEDSIRGLRYPASGEVKADVNGEMVFPGVLFDTSLDIKCSIDGGLSFDYCNSNPKNMLEAATTTYVLDPNLQGITGSLRLQDGNLCGTLNEFFGVHVTGTATLLDAQGNVLSGPVRMNDIGDFSVPLNSAGASVRLQCENAPPITLSTAGLNPVFPDLGRVTVPGVSAPTVSNMSAITLRGVQLAPPVAIFLPPPAGFPSDVLPREDAYLAVKGLDSRLSACKYYLAVGAVKACDAAGNFTGAITFQDWRHAVKIGEFAINHVPTYTATYINKVDLNLARVQESITYGPNKTAGVVCNHLGPPGGTPDQLVNPSQADIDSAVDNAVNNKNLVACVAMDYTVTPGVNGDAAFIRFLIFGPSGQLLPSINLDGRREKFVPGTCVVCHGGDHYAGKYPEDGSGFADVGGHFLPYDVGNFEFSSKAGVTETDQELALYHLNQNVLSANATGAEYDLIAGWYAGGTTLDKNYTPSSWLAVGDPTSQDFYRKVVARSCRTCHVALVEAYNFDHYENLAPRATTSVFPNASYDVDVNVCGGDNLIRRNHMMPNSLITYNRFWLSSGTTEDQPALLTQFYGPDPGNGGCPPPNGVRP